MKKTLFIICLLFSAIGFSQVTIVNGQITSGNTDQQQLSISNDTLFLQNGGFIVLPSINGEATTVSDSGEIDFTQSIYDITASLFPNSIQETKLDPGINVKLDLGNSSLQSGGPLGTPSSGILTNATGLPTSGITDGDKGVVTFASGVISLDPSTVFASNLNATNSPVDGYIYTYDSASGGGTWELTTGTDDQTASEVTYSNATSGLTATNVQGAVDEVAVTELTQAAFDALTTAQKLALGSYIILPDIPSGYSVVIDDDPMTDDGTDSFTWAGAEVGAYYDWSLSSSGGGTPVTGFGTIATATDVITIGAVSSLSSGTATLTAYLTNAGGQGADATDTAVLGTALNPPPLNGNANPELVTGNALAFGTDEVNGIANITTNSSPLVTSELIDDGYEGDYVLRIDANGQTNGYARIFHNGITVTGSTTYDFALLYKHEGTQAGDFRILGNSSGTLYDSAALSATTFTLVTGSFTTGASDTTIQAEIWTQAPFASADGTEAVEAKLSIKAQ